MAGLGEILSAALIGRAPYKRPPTVRQMIRAAYQRAGKTWRGAARDLGVSESTLRAWRAGRTPSAGKLEELRARTATVRAERIGKGNTDDQTVRLNWSFDGRERTTAGANLRLVAGTMAAVQQLLITGDTRGAVKQFLDGIGDPWYRDHFTAYEILAAAGASADNEDDDDIPDYAEEEIPTDEEPDGVYDDLAGEEIAAAIAEDQDYYFSVGGFQ